MEKEKYHRLNNDPIVLGGFSRTLPEIEWLLLVLILFYLLVGDVASTDKPVLIVASMLYGVVVGIFQYANFFKEPKEWKIAVQTWVMIFYIGYVIWFSGKLDSPLFNLYLLPIVASSVTLGRLITLLETGLIGASILYLQSTVSTEVIWSLSGSSAWLMQFFPLLLVAYITTMLASDIQRGFNRLKIISETDELTKLFNRRSLNHMAMKLFTIAARHNRNVSFIMLDVDNLKPVNDKYGHEAGNLLLINIAQCLNSVLRQGDIAARYGGDEFIIMMSECPPDKAYQVAQRIVDRLNNGSLRYQGDDIPLSASFGIASFPEHGQTVEEVIHNADVAMYRSKQRGKNLITSYELTLKKTG
jgi:diguanylate cyclase (GGDEF)-like protein